MAKNETANTEVESASVDNSKAPLFILLDKVLLKNLRTALGGDRVAFVTDDDSSAYEKLEKKLELAAAATVTKDENGNESGPFYDVAFIPRTGNDSAPLESAATIMLSTVGVRDKKTSTNGIKAIVAYEVPIAADFLAAESEAAQAFVEKVIERECSDVAFSGLRGADMTLADMQRAVEAMPTTVDDIVTTSRETSGVDSDAFDTLWVPFKNSVIKVKAPALLPVLPPKPEVQKAMRSASYALANPSTRAGEESGLWANLLNAMIKIAPDFTDDKGNPTPVDPTSMVEWLEERKELELQYAARTLESSDLAGIEF